MKGAPHMPTGRARAILRITLATLLCWIAADQALRIAFPDLLVPRHFNQANVHRMPAPFIEFKGRPGALDHNRFGYRWDARPAPPEALRIAFFGGSTGYLGKPPIPERLEPLLSARLGRPVKIANFSVISSNHRQHLHNILESRAAFEPDLVLFYGGYNELVQPAFYDPRPDHPYNFFFRGETSLLVQWLMTRSPTFTMLNRLDERFALFDMTPLAQVRTEVHHLAADWESHVVDTYFETIGFAHAVAGAFRSAHCGGPVAFRAFFQPFQPPDHLRPLVERVRVRLKSVGYALDIFDALAAAGASPYLDSVHLKEDANQIIAERIATSLAADPALAACLAAQH